MVERFITTIDTGTYRLVFKVLGFWYEGESVYEFTSAWI